jgi:N-acetylglucosamine malate deacetylase 1
MYSIRDGPAQIQITQRVVNPYRKLVSRYASLTKMSGLHDKPTTSRFRSAVKQPGAPTAIIFSPHPDDECIVGGLALRLARESCWNVRNVAVTLGSNKRRRPERLAELRRACAFLDFNLVVANGHGLENVNLETRSHRRRTWEQHVWAIASALEESRPQTVFVPHGDDGHPTHVGTHHLVMDALKTMPRDFRCFLVETEFWRQMKTPNLLVEILSDDVADLVAALAMHEGEVRRNPYHIRLPAWMIDNVRRAEIVNGPGTGAPDFTFGTLQCLRQWKRGRLLMSNPARKFLSGSENPALLFQ